MQRTPQELHQTPRPKIRILSAGSYEAPRNLDFPPHLHSYSELVYYRSGAIDCVMDDKTYPGQMGMAWLTPPGVTHAERAVTAYSNYYIALNVERPDRWPPFLEDGPDQSLGRVCQQIVIEFSRPSPEQSEMLELLAAQLSFLLDRASRDRVLSHPAQVVARAERLIEEKCHQSLTIEAVAETVNASVSALRSYFQTVRGCSPRSHLQQVRLDKAIRFLRTSTLKLETIAELCGYDSASHLTRCVKKTTRQTPGQLRATAFPARLNKSNNS